MHDRYVEFRSSLNEVLSILTLKTKFIVRMHVNPGPGNVFGYYTLIPH